MSRRLGLVVIFAVALLAPGCELFRPRPAEPTDVAARLVSFEARGPALDTHGAELQALLDSDVQMVRASAADLLGQWAANGDPRWVLPAVVHPDPLVRALAQETYLAHNPRGLGVLSVEGQVIEVPPEALKALTEMLDPQGLPDLAEEIRLHRDGLREHLDVSPQEGVLAADILARVGDAGARRRLLELLDSDSDAVLAVAAAASVHPRMDLGATMLPEIAAAGGVLGRRAAMRALVMQPSPTMRNFVNEGLRDEDVAVRRNAIRAAGKLGAAAPVERLEEILTARASAGRWFRGESRPTGEKHDALRALGAIGGPRAVEILRTYALGDPETTDLQAQALLALAPHADRTDIDWVSQRLRAADARLRAAAASVLGQIGHPASQAALLLAAEDDEPLVRATIAKALGQIGTEYAAKHLMVMLEDPSGKVGAMAAWGLGESGDPQAVPALVALAADAAAAAPPPRIG